MPVGTGDVSPPLSLLKRKSAPNSNHRQDVCNSELSNASFAEKRALLGDSHFVLNRWIAGRTNWTADDIGERAKALADVAVTIWRRPA